ncbi:hypothetical protein [Brevibacillus invocatus]|uniref:hypothetical protein n=1 Tax=Brevibacillus invocatus TaxID=173959 RepID=UPI00204255B7|nr:hypothetical protein [Brevibacillus invocatus]MCM3079429.1 hypothetical protein [Brevibacillus invocatus]MCM3429519.1 hypothetical protein [Brevibacillus invocatus]
MTYNTINNMMTNQQNQLSSIPQSANSMFQPGYAGTNTQEVQHWNQGGHTQTSITPTYGTMSYSGNLGSASAQSMFQPGFANTNTQEVRQLNAGYAAPQQNYQQAQMGGFQQNQAAFQPSYGMQANSIFSPGFAGTNTQEVQARNNSSYTGYSSMNALPMQSGYAAQGQAQLYSGGVGSIYSPGFAGTNTQEVQARNNTGYAGYNSIGYAAQMQAQPFSASTGSVFSPGFAGTNAQEVRQNNQAGYSSPSLMSGGYQQQQSYHSQQPQQLQAYSSPFGAGAQSVFSPNFAGTNVQEVRSLNAGQAPAHTGSIFPGSF